MPVTAKDTTCQLNRDMQSIIISHALSHSHTAITHTGTHAHTCTYRHAVQPASPAARLWHTFVIAAVVRRRQLAPQRGHRALLRLAENDCMPLPEGDGHFLSPRGLCFDHVPPAGDMHVCLCQRRTWPWQRWCLDHATPVVDSCLREREGDMHNLKCSIFTASQCAAEG